MTRQLLFVQGGAAKTRMTRGTASWSNLESELGSDYKIRYPRMPDEDDFGGTPQRVTG